MTNPYNKDKGRGITFLREHVGHTGDECLPWPLSRDDKGHAIVGWMNRRFKAARVMCELVNGPPPTPEHETAHSCGKGHEGCVNPVHLSWKTRAGNQQDRKMHGTTKPLGSPRNKLTPEEITEIRALGGTMTHKALAVRFNTVPSNISKIMSGARWQKTPPWLKAGLTPADLAAIRASTEPRRVVAERYGIGESSVWRIRHGAAFDHVR